MTSRLALLLGLALAPGVAFAQTITITPQVGTGQKTILGLEDCQNLATQQSFYTVLVDFSPATPPTGATFTVKLGVTCDTNDTTCQTLEVDQPLTLAQTTQQVQFAVQDAVAAVGVAACENIDEKLKLFVDVEDSQGTLLKSASTPDTESLFVDTLAPEPPLSPAGSGGEKVLHVEWETNPANAAGSFVLGAQEAGFQVRCRLAADTTAEFVDCGPLVTALASDVNDIDGVELENDIDIEFGVITIDPAGNESALSATAVAAPQDVIDFGENFPGAEQGGCDVSPEGDARAMVIIALAIALILVLRRQERTSKGVE
jgi:hypothetical protein